MPTIPLETPVTRGETQITEIQLRKPSAGELRGIVLSDLLRMEAGAVATVLPRITTPTLTAQEVAAMDSADFTACALGVADFLLPKSMRPATD
jgi:tail assembly chaperone E/41/14-like protein